MSLFARPCAQHPELQQQQYQADPRAEQAWRQQHQQQQRAQPQQQVLTRLLELSLQFCIYTEAANLRHTPHLLFLIYYVLRGSSTFLQVCCAAGINHRQAHIREVVGCPPFCCIVTGHTWVCCWHIWQQL